MKEKEVKPIVNVWTVLSTYSNLSSGNTNTSHYYFFLSKDDACKWIEQVIESKSQRYKTAQITKDGDIYHLDIPGIKRSWTYKPVILYDYDIRKQKG